MVNIKLLRSFIRESLGREIMFSPEKLSLKDAEGSQQREVTVVDTVDKTKLSVEEVLEELILAAGPNTYIRFEKKYGDLEFPPLKISPRVNYQTPHGIYGYPLDKVNVENLVNTGMPTNEGFATKYDFFHVYKLDNSRTANLSKTNNKNYDILGMYTSKQKIINDIAECIRIASNMLKTGNNLVEITSETLDQHNTSILSDISQLSQSDYQVDEESNIVQLNDIFKKYKDFVVKTNNDLEVTKSFIEEYKREIAVSIFNIINKKIRNQGIRGIQDAKVTKQFVLFRILKSSIEYIAESISKTLNTQRGQYYSLLLKAIGLTGISDLGTETVHSNEPDQTVSFDFSGDTIKPVGTFKNIFRNFLEFYDLDLKKKFYQILNDLIDNDIVTWDISNDSAKSRRVLDYKNLSLESFNTVFKYKKSIGEPLNGFINNFASQNKNPSVLEKIFEIAQEPNEEFSESTCFSFMIQLVRNKNLPAHISKELYTKYTRPNLNKTLQEILDENNYNYSTFLNNFLSSPTLLKEDKIEIIEKTKKPKIQTGQQFVLKVLVRSNFLEREVAQLIASKFGYRRSGLNNNNKAPMSDVALQHAIKEYNLDSKEITELSSIIRASAIKSLYMILSNPHASDKEIKYVLSKLSPVLKQISNIPVQEDYYGDPMDSNVGSLRQSANSIMYNISEEGNITSEHLKAANLSLEEEANILKIFTFNLWSNDEDTYIDVDEDDLVSPDKFDMSKHGITYLNNDSPYRPCKNLRKVFARSYDYFKNLSK